MTQEVLTDAQIAAADIEANRLEREAIKRERAERYPELTKFAKDGTVLRRGADWNFPIGWKDQHE